LEVWRVAEKVERKAVQWVFYLVCLKVVVMAVMKVPWLADLLVDWMVDYLVSVKGKNWVALMEK